MYSEGLRLLDLGTVQYMIEEQQAQIEQLKQKDETKQQLLLEQQAEIARLKSLLNQQQP